MTWQWLITSLAPVAAGFLGPNDQPSAYKMDAPP
jgi:hypothetical protein